MYEDGVEQVACSRPQAALRPCLWSESECEQATGKDNSDLVVHLTCLWLPPEVMHSCTTHEQNRSHLLIQHGGLRAKVLQRVGLTRE